MLTDKQLQAAANYGYDKSGNLIKDKSEGIKEIKWTSTGKVKEIIRDEYEKTAQPDLEFHYDCFGRRISKTMKPRHTLDNNLYVLSPISEWVTSYYVHDAQGNEMATYNIHGQENNVRALHLKEQYIYGSSRIGAVDNDKEINSACDLGLNTYGTATIKRSVNGQPSFVDPITVKIGGLSITNPNETYHSFDELESAINRYVSKVDYIAYKDPSDPFNKLIIRATVYGGSSFNGPIRTISVTGNISVDKNFEEGNFVTCIQKNVRGMKRYEITNYLGNVHAVLTDRKSPVQDLNNPSRVAFYQAEVVSYTDYYPFGMLMLERSSNSDAYNRGYNGQLKVDEISGEGNHTTALFWEYDTRLGRRWNRDPKPIAEESEYATNRNNPIKNSDPNGDTPSTDPPTVSAGLKFNIGSHNNNLSFNLSITQSIGNFNLSAGVGLSAAGTFNNTGKSGLELRGSLMAGYQGSGGGVSLGTNLFKGLGGLKDFSQRTGIFNFNVGKFNASYENDGFPFGLGQKGLAAWAGDGNDRYRTAAVRLGFGDFSAGFNLFTGSRTSYEGDNDKKNHLKIGQYGEKMPHGYVIEDGTPYRMGAAFVGYGNTKLGIDSDRWIRHPIQDNWAHNMPGTKQPGFKSLSNSINPFFQTTSSDIYQKNSSPRFTLYDY